MNRKSFLQDLEMNVRRKIYKKRAVASVFWSIGADVKLAVKLFNLVQKAVPSKHVSVDLRTSKVLQIAGSHICNDTGKPRSEFVTKARISRSEQIRMLCLSCYCHVQNSRSLMAALIEDFARIVHQRYLARYLTKQCSCPEIWCTETNIIFRVKMTTKCPQLLTLLQAGAQMTFRM